MELVLDEHGNDSIFLEPFSPILDRGSPALFSLRQSILGLTRARRRGPAQGHGTRLRLPRVDPKTDEKHADRHENIDAMKWRLEQEFPYCCSSAQTTHEKWL